ncbi:MAG TPA: hypothetical protein VMT09_06730 [Steroidobacteraceae bacterium]|nr:hypothetical protein [Steroidobacteraceae bacterium]
MRHNYVLAMVGVALGAIAVIGAPGVARADQAVMATGSLTDAEKLLVNPYTIDLGTYLVSSQINGDLRGSAGGQNVDFDHDFGTDATETRVRVGFLWRITPTQAVRFNYFDNNVSSTRQLTRNIEWGDNTYQAGFLATAQYKFNIYEASYEWAFIKDRNYDVSLTAGVHVEDFTLKIAGTATVTPPGGGPPSSASAESQSNSVTAPLPVIGLRGGWAATDHLFFDLSGQLFKFSYEGIDGNWSDIWVGMTWMFNEHFGVGVAYDRFAIHVDLTKGSFDGRLNLGYQGGLIFVKGAF